MRRVYDPPLPSGVGAAFAYYDQALGGWRIVPSSLSADRRTLTATIHHFSPWTDVTAAAGAWIERVSPDATYHIGSFFDARVEPPKCSGKPDWVRTATYLDDKNAPLRWCYGSDPDQPDVLVVKVRVNRGYGYPVVTATAPAWTWSSYLNRDAAAAITAVVTDYPKEAGRYLSHLASGGQNVPGGTEIDYGFSESQVRRAPGSGLALVRAESGDLTELVFNLIVGAMADQVGQPVAALILGMLAVIHCGAEIVKAGSNWSRLAGAVTDCLIAGRESLTRQLAKYLVGRSSNIGPEAAAAKAAGITRKLIYVTAAGIFFQLASYIGDLELIDAARTFNVFTTAIKRANPKVIRFDGVGAVRLGMTASQLRSLGYSASAGEYYGCKTYQKADALSVQYNPTTDKVVNISDYNDSSYRTTTGIRIGSTLAAARQAYAGLHIEEHLDQSFGQGSDGILVRGTGGWIGLSIASGHVDSIQVGDYEHATNAEAGCEG